MPERHFQKFIISHVYGANDNYVHCALRLSGLETLSQIVNTTESAGLQILSGFFYKEANKENQYVWSFFCQQKAKESLPLARLELIFRALPTVLDMVITLSKEGLLSDKTDFPVTTGNDSKVVLMRQEALQTMEQAIRRTFSSGADVIFYDQGQAMGKLLGDSLIQKLGVDFLRNNPIELFSFYQSFGWCKFQVKTWDQEKGRAELIAHENSECVGLRSDKPTGHMIRGHLCGLIEAVWGTKVKTTETECASMGHEACKYSIVTA